MQLAWPTLLKSKLAYWLNLGYLIYPDMAKDGVGFDRLVEACREKRKATNKKFDAQKDITAALEASIDPKSGLSMSEDERWTELFMLVRAGESPW